MGVEKELSLLSGTGVSASGDSSACSFSDGSFVRDPYPALPPLGIAE